MKKISKRLREEAAQFCSMLACHGESISVAEGFSRLYGEPATAARFNDVARLAVRAWDAANRTLNLASPRETSALSIRDDYAEAEAMLRTGWSP